MEILHVTLTVAHGNDPHAFYSKLSFLPPYSIAQLQSFSNVCMKHNVALILHSLLVSDNFMAYHSIGGTFELTYF